ncbi:MAG: MFS transporter [Promethearchaeota archaeon]
MSEQFTPEFKKSYPYIFSFFYLVQGLYNGLQAIVLPIYLITVIEGVDLAYILIILSVATIPWALKFFIGMLNDKYGSEKLGRRRPWIFIFGIYGGVWFIITGLYLPTQLDLETIELINLVGFLAIMWNIGWAIADTALDGLILDVTPKEKLGKVQGYTWAMNLFGSSALGILMGAAIFIFDLFTFFFVLEGFLFFIAVCLPFLIGESKVPEEVHVWRDFKKILGNIRNIKLFLSSILDHIPYAVVTLAFGLLVIIYWPYKLVDVDVTSIALAGESIDLLIIFAIFGAIGGIGIVGGSIYSGFLSDKNRRKSIYIAHVIYIPCLFVCVFFTGAFFGALTAIILAVIMTIILGIGEGALSTSFQAVRGDIAKQYPDLDGTYYALVISCLNAGHSLGYLVAGALLLILSGFFTEFWIIFFIVMVIMAVFQLSALGIFLTIDRNDYEFAKILEERNRV